ncbi:MAG: glycosyltransferase 87 family protein [Jatrophihabitans sp.]|uniref:glycosyltransferase 87 family protein n=1 Tax=Jatrophihabitans sp. TaxID=1932789 RepID=UPI003F81F3EE
MHHVVGRTSLIRLAVVAVVVSSVWWCFAASSTPADLRTLLVAGRAIAQGETPYVGVGSSVFLAGHAFVYPWLTALPFVPLAAMSWAAAYALFFFLSALAVLGGVRLARPGVAWSVSLGVLLLEPTIRGLQLGTLNAWLFLLLALAWRFRRRPAVLVTALAAAIIAKLFLLPMLVWLIGSGRRRSAASTAGLVLAGVVAGCAFAEQSLGTYEHLVNALSAHESTHSSSLVALLASIGITGAPGAVAALGLAALGIAAAWRWSRTRGDERLLFCGCVVASVAASPIVWSHYFLLPMIVPVLFGWRPTSVFAVVAASWLIAVPSGLPALLRWQRYLHPFPGSSWLLAAAIACLVAGWRWRAHSQPPVRRCPPSCGVDQVMTSGTVTNDL